MFSREAQSGGDNCGIGISDCGFSNDAGNILANPKSEIPDPKSTSRKTRPPRRRKGAAKRRMIATARVSPSPAHSKAGVFDLGVDVRDENVGLGAYIIASLADVEGTNAGSAFHLPCCAHKPADRLVTQAARCRPRSAG